MNSVKTLLHWSKGYLKRKGVSSFALDAELILASVINADRTHIYAHPERQLNENERLLFKDIVLKRGRRYPLAYVLKRKEFFGIDLHVEEGVFCPRPETEILVEEVIRTFHVKDASANGAAPGKALRSATKRAPIDIFEIGLGTGAISVSLAVHLPHARIRGCDVDPRALAVTRRNIKSHGVEDRVSVVRGSLFEVLKKNERFDCIVSNPPYLSRKDYLDAEAEVRKEPRRALMARERGLFIIRHILRNAPRHLNPGGWLFIELGHGQGGDVLEYAVKQGFTGEVIADLGFKERVFAGRLTAGAAVTADRGRNTLQ